MESEVRQRRPAAVASEHDGDEEILEVEGALHPHDIKIRVNLGSTLGGLYCMTISILGLVFPLSYILTDWSPDRTYHIMMFYVYIFTVSLIFLMYVQRRLLKCRRHRNKMYMKHKTLYGWDNKAADVSFSNSQRDAASIANAIATCGEVNLDGEPIFYQANEGVNFFLRLGAIGFASATMLLDGFLISQFLDRNSIVWHCYGKSFLVMTSFRIVFVFTETFFIFKYHKIVLNFRKPLMKFGLMHIIATNLCLWSFTVCLEAAEMFAHNFGGHGDSGDHGDNGDHGLSDNGHSNISNLNAASTTNLPGEDHIRITTSAGGYHTVIDSTVCFTADLLANDVGPYLFPFVIEFALIAASIVFRMYGNVGVKPEPEEEQEHGEDKKRQLTVSEQIDFGGECHKANHGLFRGLLIFVLILLFVSLFLIIKEKYSVLNNNIAGKLYFGTNIGINIVGLLIIVPAWNRLRHLKFSEKLESNFDQNLAFLALGGYYFLIAAMLIASAAQLTTDYSDEGHLFVILHFVSNIFTFLQVSFQTFFIVDSLRRRSTLEMHIVLKPGRSSVTYLLIINISMWIINTFMLKELSNSRLMTDFYGALAWNILIQLFLPLSIFYRFHSAVCLAEVWSSAYKMEEGSHDADINIIVKESIIENNVYTEKVETVSEQVELNGIRGTPAEQDVMVRL